MGSGEGTNNLMKKGEKLRGGTLIGEINTKKGGEEDKNKDV